ncbi:MAG TPA: hypothetical protein ENJ06_01475 [Phycisphaeraceae bacterium]|nr:hypothetical protein [Phycisphaeraceae bacterium]
MIPLLSVLVFALPVRSEQPPLSPRDVPFYEVDNIKNLTLTDMHWQQVAELDEDGVTVIAGYFDALDWNTYDVSFDPVTLPWLQRGILFLPPGYPQGLKAGAANKAVLYNSHDVDPGSERFYYTWGVELARAFNIPVLLHGWDPALTLPAGYNSVHEMQFPLVDHFLDSGFCRWGDVPLDGSYGVNGNILVKGDMVAITLLQRLAEQKGGNVTRVGSLGISKEGGSHWILAAIDDRVEVVAPGGDYAQNMHALDEAYFREWGSRDHSGSPPDLNIARITHRLDSWACSTEMGRILNRINNPAQFSNDIYARYVLINGDVTLQSMHDRAFPLGAEQVFLDGFESVPWSYVRIPDGSGVLLDDNMSERAYSLLPMVADKLINDANYPSVINVQYEVSPDHRFRVIAELADSDLPELTVSLWAATSTTRWWTQVVQGEWIESAMTRMSGNTWVSDWSVQVPADQAAAFLVEAKTTAHQGNYWFYRVDTSQPQFLWQRPSPDPLVRYLLPPCR